MSKKSKHLFTTAQLGSLFVFIAPFALCIHIFGNSPLTKERFVTAVICGGMFLTLAVIIAVTKLVKNKEFGFYWFLSSSLSIMAIELSFVTLLITGSFASTTMINNPLTVAILVMTTIVVIFLVMISSHVIDSIEEYYDIPKRSTAWRSIFQMMYITGIIILSYYALI